MSNYSDNKKAIDEFRKELRAMLDDIRDIDVRVLNKAVREGIKVAKNNTPTVTSYMKKSWGSEPTIKSNEGVTKVMYNSRDYASYVNYGHRIVNKEKETIGFVKGKFILEKAIDKTEKVMSEEFKKEIERVNKKYDK